MPVTVAVHAFNLFIQSLLRYYYFFQLPTILLIDCSSEAEDRQAGIYYSTTTTLDPPVQIAFQHFLVPAPVTNKH